MKHEDLIKNTSELGFNLGPEKQFTDYNRTLAEVVLSRDSRFWEAFPVMLANAAEEEGFKPEVAQAYLQAHEKEYFKGLMIMSAALYRHLGLKFAWAGKAVAGFARGTIVEYEANFKQGTALRIGPERLLPRNVIENFITGFKKREERLKKAARSREQLGLEYAMARIFPPGQKRLFLKKLRGEPLTKTEGEYFSRVIKKKAQALANEDLHKMARKVIA